MKIEFHIERTTEIEAVASSGARCGRPGVSGNFFSLGQTPAADGTWESILPNNMLLNLSTTEKPNHHFNSYK